MQTEIQMEGYRIQYNRILCAALQYGLKSDVDLLSIADTDTKRQQLFDIHIKVAAAQTFLHLLGDEKYFVRRT